MNDMKKMWNTCRFVDNVIDSGDQGRVVLSLRAGYEQAYNMFRKYSDAIRDKKREGADKNAIRTIEDSMKMTIEIMEHYSEGIERFAWEKNLNNGKGGLQ